MHITYCVQCTIVNANLIKSFTNILCTNPWPNVPLNIEGENVNTLRRDQRDKKKLNFAEIGRYIIIL